MILWESSSFRSKFSPYRDKILTAISLTCTTSWSNFIGYVFFNLYKTDCSPSFLLLKHGSFQLFIHRRNCTDFWNIKYGLMCNVLEQIFPHWKKYSKFLLSLKIYCFLSRGYWVLQNVNSAGFLSCLVQGYIVLFIPDVQKRDL